MGTHCGVESSVQNYDYAEPRGGLGLSSFLIGAAVGVIGTFIYAVSRRREFDQVVDKVSDVAGKGSAVVNDLKHRGRDLMDHVSDHVEHDAREIKRAVDETGRSIAKGVTRP